MAEADNEILLRLKNNIQTIEKLHRLANDEELSDGVKNAIRLQMYTVVYDMTMICVNMSDDQRFYPTPPAKNKTLPVRDDRVRDDSSEEENAKSKRSIKPRVTGSKLVS